MAPIGHWYLWIHRSPRRFSTLERRIPRSRVCVLRLFTFTVLGLIRLPGKFLGPRPNSLPLCTLRLVRPHKVSAVQERYAAYGDRVEIGPVDDLIKGDLTDALKGVYTYPTDERNTASVVFFC